MRTRPKICWTKFWLPSFRSKMSNNNGDRSVGSVAIVVAAAGMGTRLQVALPKALENVAGAPLLAHCLTSLLPVPDVGVVVVTSPRGFEDQVCGVCAGFPQLPTAVVTGGAERSDSIALALQAVPSSCEVVLVHDAARAFAPAVLFERVVSAVRGGASAVVPGLAVNDTIRQLGSDGAVRGVVDRSNLRRVQTPQGFRRDELVAAYQRYASASVTDDASLMELAGVQVVVVDGDEAAFKVTTPFDRKLAEVVVKSRELA